MIFITSGYFQDGLKAIVYLMPLIYLVVRRKQLKLKYFRLFLVGLLLLFFGHFLDFLDEFEFLRNAFTSESQHLLEDFLEDIVGFTLGFAIFILAFYSEFKERTLRLKNEE